MWIKIKGKIDSILEFGGLNGDVFILNQTLEKNNDDPQLHSNFSLQKWYWNFMEIFFFWYLKWFDLICFTLKYIISSFVTFVLKDLHIFNEFLMLQFLKLFWPCADHLGNIYFLHQGQGEIVTRTKTNNYHPSFFWIIFGKKKTKRIVKHYLCILQMFFVI